LYFISYVISITRVISIIYISTIASGVETRQEYCWGDRRDPRNQLDGWWWLRYTQKPQTLEERGFSALIDAGRSGKKSVFISKYLTIKLQVCMSAGRKPVVPA